MKQILMEFLEFCFTQTIIDHNSMSQEEKLYVVPHNSVTKTN